MSGMVSGQQVMIDRGVRVEGLWCFPDASDSLSYYYLPNEASLALDKQGDPEFSFIRYVITQASAANDANSIQQAGGGAILHFLIRYETSDETVTKAEKALKEKLQNDKVKLKGPVIFKQGKYNLISSILNKDGKKQNMLMASGNAPVLEGSRIALSFEMKPETSKLLLESFKMATPDISIVFDLEFSGLSDAFNAEMEINWSQVQKSQHIKAGLNVYYVSADLDMLYNDLRKNNAIKLTVKGDDANMQALINRVYEKLTDIFFTQVEPEKVPPTVKNDIVDGVKSMIKNFAGKSPYSISGAYKLNELKSSGYSTLSFNSNAVVDRHHMITFNIGDLYKKYGNDKHFFKTVNMDDPDFQQRTVQVAIDGTLQNELGKMINNVTVTLKKVHENGVKTLREVVVTPETLKNSLFSLKMVYGSEDDKDRLKWLTYQYRTSWKFSGGGEYTTDWLTESSSMINLFAPFKRTEVQLFGDTEKLKSEGVRVAIVQITYPFFGETRTKRLTWKPGDNPDDKTIEITLPLKDENYGYKITWVMQDGSRKQKEGSDNTGIIFIDEF